jgi:hypothetical protein
VEINVSKSRDYSVRQVRCATFHTKVVVLTMHKTYEFALSLIYLQLMLLLAGSHNTRMKQDLWILSTILNSPLGIMLTL